MISLAISDLLTVILFGMNNLDLLGKPRMTWVCKGPPQIKDSDAKKIANNRLHFKKGQIHFNFKF